MTTRTLPLPPAAWYPTNDAANFDSAQLQVKQSSTAVPSPRWLEWLFDATSDEFIITSFVMPGNYVSSPVLKVYYKCTSATSGTAAFESRLSAITDGDAEDMDSDAFAAVNAGSATVPGTAGYIDVISIALTSVDSVAAGDHVVLSLNRDTSADTVTGDLEVFNCELQYNDV